MATIRCPQCGTEFEKGSVEFCPNPNCGYPVAFLEEGALPEEPTRMERRPGEQAAPQPPPPPTPPPAPPKPPRNWRPLLFIGGAVLVIAIIVVAFLLLTGGDKEKADGGKGGGKSPTSQPSKKPTKKPSQKPSTKPSTKPTQTPTKPPKGIQLPFTAADPQSDLRGTGAQSINAMLGTGKQQQGQLVAAGSTESVGENDAAVWHSTDGRTWVLDTDQTDLGGPGEQQINGISPIKGGGFVAVGSDTSSGSEDAAVWLSPDSDSWTKVTGDDDLGGPGRQSMHRVSGTGTPAGILAVGSTTNSEDGTQDGAIWASTDNGSSWTLLPTGDQLGGPGDQDIFRLTVLKSGITTGFVAVGTSTLNGDSDAAVWTSTDAQTWTRVDDPDDVLGGDGNQGMTDVQTFEDGLVAGGFATGDGLDAAIWLSTNGTDWTKVNQAQLGGDGDQSINRILTTKEVEGSDVPLIVAGGTSTVDGDQDAAIWYSNDASHWNREVSSAAALGGQNEQAINTISQRDETIVAVGSDASAGDQNAGVWTADSPAAPA
jgi:hypothetical protein